MYSYEERIRAVKLYIKLSKRTGPTIRQLGYPKKNSLKGRSWTWSCPLLAECLEVLDLSAIFQQFELMWVL